jgi:hypothetical protein
MAADILLTSGFGRNFGNHLWQFFRSISEKQIETITRNLTRQQQKKKIEKYNLLCRNCHNLITNNREAVPIAGSHRHNFINPASIHYEIGCFADAVGCFNMGEPTVEFTWFPGYSWCYSVCNNCFSHLGWFFQSGEHQFYGLILNKLMKEKEE